MKKLLLNLSLWICLLSVLMPDGGRVFGTSLLPSFTAWQISTSNSSTSNLASGASFTGTSEDVSDFSSVQINFKADQNVTVQQEQSNDGTNWDLIDSYTIAANTADSRSFTIMRQFFRIIVTNNGGSTTTLLRLQTVYVPILSTFPRSLTTLGNLKVAVQEALPAGGATIGAVTQASGPWTSNITQIGGASLALGQTTMSASIPVVIASNQSAVPVSQSGAPWSENITQFGGVNISTGTGASGTGIPRVTVSNDSNILSSQSGTWTVQQGTPPWTQNITQFGGTNVVTGTGNSGAGIPRVTVSSDSSITNISGTVSLPTGASTSGNQTNGTQKTQVVDGSGNIQPSGDVLTRKIFVQPTDGANNQGYTASNEAKVLVTPLTNSSVVKAQLQDNAGTAVTLGQKAMTSSVPVVLASDQTGINTFLDKSGSGTITALNASVTATTNGDSSVVFNITGTWAATLSVQGQDSDGNWVFIQSFSPNDNSIIVNATVNRMVVVPAGGFTQVRITATAYTSGTATVSWNSGSGTNVVQGINTNAANFLVTATQSGTWAQNLTQVGGSSITLGQKVMASSLPVTLSSDQAGMNAFLDKNATGTIGALNGTVSLTSAGMSSVVVTVTGTWVATLSFQGFDGTNWINASGLTLPAGGITTALSANGSAVINTGGFSQFRIIATAYTSGTANIFLNAGAGAQLMAVYNDSQDPLITKAQLQDNSANGITSTTINSKQRLDINSASDGTDGAAVPFATTQVGGRDGSSNLQTFLTDTSGNLGILLKDASANGITSSTLPGTAASKQGVDVTPMSPVTNYYSAPVNIRQSATTAANATVWTMRNAAASTKTVIIERIQLMMSFDTGTPLGRALNRYDLVRFSAATPTAGTAITVVLMDTSSAATQVTDVRFVDTGLTTTGVTFATAMATIGCPATDATSCNYVRDKIGIKLAPGEGLAIRLDVVAAVGQGLVGEVIWSER